MNINDKKLIIFNIHTFKKEKMKHLNRIIYLIQK